ncbi:MAG: M42 family metallopeptidase [Candidatus Aminicenantales bacterium]
MNLNRFFKIFFIFAREKNLVSLAFIILMVGWLTPSSPSLLSGQDKLAWNILKELLLIPGVSTQEKKVGEAIAARLTTVAKPQTDDMGNVWITVGEGRPYLFFVAHMDELGLFVREIGQDGRLRLRGTGGYLLANYEAEPITVWTKKGPVPGLIRARQGYSEAEPSPLDIEKIEADVGAETVEEAKTLGIEIGDQVTYGKRILELTPDILASRAVDDRAGCAAQLAAALKVDWRQIKKKKVTLAWSVQEEVGLRGAARLAETMKPDYVFAVDTFVSTDSPLENPRFGFARLGEGAVVRAIDSSTIVPHHELERIIRLARERQIPLQLANSRGGNDGSVFVPWGAVNIPLSWPGAYAHSFIEKIHRRDLEALTDLIVAIIESW